MGQSQTKRVSVSSDGTMQVFSYSELAKATENFSPHCGEYYGFLKDGRRVSVEKQDQYTFRKFKAEQKLISRLFPHRNLVSIYGYTNKEEKFLLVHEYMSNGTLADHLYGEAANSRTLPWSTRLDIAIDVANALAYLHILEVVHGHITPANILLDEDFCAKVRLDVSTLVQRVSDDDETRVVGTLGYLDPDYMINNRVNFHTDVYIFGVVLCQLLSSKRAVFSTSDGTHGSLVDFVTTKARNNELDELLDPRLQFQFDDKTKQMMTAVADLAIQCLQPSVNLRPSITRLRDHLLNIRQKNLQFRISPDNELEDTSGLLDIRQGDSQLRTFSYNELEDATDRFYKYLGKGAFGIVFYGKLQDGREVAVKRFLQKKDKTTMQQFAKEVEVLSMMRHQHLVSLYGCSSNDSEELILVYEYVSNGTLSIHLRQHPSGQLPWLTRLNIAIQTASALAYLHSSGIIHRDVKASNILLDDNFSVKVADFGLSRFLPQSGSQGSYDTHVSTAPQGTYGYMDPEYITYKKVSDKSDVYSFGVVLFELISTKTPAFMDGPQHVTLANFAMSKILNKALEELVDPSMQFDSDNEIIETITAVAELAFQCVQCPKELRPSMKQVLETLEGIKQGTWEFNQIT